MVDRRPHGMLIQYDKASSVVKTTKLDRHYGQSISPVKRKSEGHRKRSVGLFMAGPLIPFPLDPMIPVLCLKLPVNLVNYTWRQPVASDPLIDLQTNIYRR